MPPEQLGYCETCNAPIYMENIAGACTCQEGKLRALAATLPQRVARLTTPAGLKSSKPLSPRPTRASEATSVIAPQPDLQSILMADARRDLGLGEEFERFDREIRAGLNIPEPAVRSTNRSPATPPAGFNLESLWTNGEIEDAFDPVVNASDTPDFTEEIQFDSGEDIEFESLPQRVGGEETRFRVDRGAPQREPFRGNIEPGPQGGPMREVGRSGRFPVMREVPLPNQPGTRYFASEPELVGHMPTRREFPVAPKPTPREESPIHRPTIYDRLRNGNFLDDD